MCIARAARAVRILLIEDDEGDALLFKNHLKSESDLEVFVEASLGDGMDRCDQGDFDLVVLDLRLPDSSGLDTLTTFFNEVESAPGVVVLTGLDDQEMALKAVQAGAQDFVVKGEMKPASLVPALRHAVERQRLAQELMAANERVRYLATHCSLTDLPNRYLFLDRLGNAIAASKRSGTGLSVLFIDLNRFKPINDTYGHEAGDIVLRTVGKRLRAITRDSDTVARLGGDEFTVLLREIADPVSIERVAQKVAHEISKPIEIDGVEVSAHPSIGSALYPSDGASGEAILRNADAAMYYAKKHNETHRMWSRSLRTGARYRIELESELSHAIENDELELHYQPQVDGRTGAIIGFEALVRWDRPGHGWVPPIDFIPFAEKCGLIDDLGLWVLRTAAGVQSRWLGAGFGHGRVSVNVSPRQLRGSRFVSQVREILESFDLSGSDITLEVTESCLIDDRAGAIDVLGELRADGVMISVDDFGTGYSSLGLLAELPLDCLKIDRRFVQGAPDDPRQGATTRAIINLGLDLGFELVAEGVETREQHAFLLEHGCEKMQGFRYSRGVPETSARELLEAGPIVVDDSGARTGG